MATEISNSGSTPNGGVRSTAYFQDDNGDPADETAATRVEIVEFDADGNQVFRTYGEISRKKKD